MNLAQRMSNVACIGLYLYVFIIGYRLHIYPVYDYYGMGWNDMDGLSTLTIWCMNLSLAFFMPLKYRRPSHLFLAVQFLIVFLPASVVCLNSSLPTLPSAQILLMLMAMYVGLCIQTYASYVSRAIVQRPIRECVTPGRFLKVFGAASAFILLSMVYVLRDIFQFSSLDEIYAQRDLLDGVSLGAFFTYGLAWQLTVFLPAILTAGFLLRGRQRLLALIGGTIGYVLLLGLTATKTALLAPLIIGSIFLLLKDRRQPFIGLFALGLSGLICIPFVMDWLSTPEIIKAWYVGIVNFRILSVPQLLYSQYLDFFSHHPLTYGSHISVVNLFVAYPYQEAVYKIIGEYYYPGSNMTANAGMWAQDGIAGFGIPGIVVVSVIFSVLMIALDIAARPHNARWLGASLAMVSLYVSNASLFTTFLTGGLGLVILFLFISKPIAWPTRIKRQPTQHSISAS